jgi:hypothetical protein
MLAKFVADPAAQVLTALNAALTTSPEAVLTKRHKTPEHETRSMNPVASSNDWLHLRTPEQILQFWRKNLLEVRDLLRLQGREDWRFTKADILHLDVFTHTSIL